KSVITDVSATAEGVLSRIKGLPVEELMAGAINFLNTATALVADEKLRETPAEVFALVEDMRGLVGSEEAQNVPILLNSAIGRVEELLARLDEEEAVARLVGSLEAVSRAASQIGDASTSVPSLLQDVERLAEKAVELPLDQLLVETRGLISSGRVLIESEGVNTLPDNLNKALAEVEILLSDLRAERGVQRLFEAIDSVAFAAKSADASIAGVPDLIAGLNKLVEKADGLPLEDVTERLADVLASTNALIDTPDARELPANLSDALGELQATLSELRQGGVVENVNKTLESARFAADKIAVSVQDLPALVDRMVALLNQASLTLQSYDGKSELNRGARVALRDIAEAAEAVSSLARTLERNPNSLLLGR
ncbi:MAG: hypothetical protein ABJ327_01525, partial [Litoreibacter sp.]